MSQTELTRPGERLDQVANAAATFLPALGLAGIAWQVWGSALHWQDLIVFATTVALAGFGVTVGFHRLFTHRSFKTTRWLRALLAILRCAAGGRDPRLGGGRGAGDRVGLLPPPPSPVLGRRGRSALAARRPRAGLARCAPRALPRPPRLGALQRRRGARGPLRARPAEGPDSADHRQDVHPLGGRRARVLLRAGR